MAVLHNSLPDQCTSSRDHEASFTASNTMRYDRFCSDYNTLDINHVLYNYLAPQSRNQNVYVFGPLNRFDLVLFASVFSGHV